MPQFQENLQGILYLGQTKHQMQGVVCSSLTGCYGGAVVKLREGVGSNTRLPGAVLKFRCSEVTVSTATQNLGKGGDKYAYGKDSVGLANRTRSL